MKESEADLLVADGVVDRDTLSVLVLKFMLAGNNDALSQLLNTVATHNPGTFEGAYWLLEPVLSFLDRPEVSSIPDEFDVDSVLSEWAARLGLMRPDYLNAMLAKDQMVTSASWLMEMDADPNAALDPESLENLTVIGHICRVMRREHRDDDAVRMIIRELLTRGEVPYYVKPRYEGDPSACDLFSAVMMNVEDADCAVSVLCEATGLAHRADQLPVEVEEVIGQAYLKARQITGYHQGGDEGGMAYQLLSYARYTDPGHWETVFGKLTFSADSLFLLQGSDSPRRLMKALARDGARMDDVPAFITEDHIPCTLLQAAAFSGQEWAVKDMLEAGADPARTVGAESKKRLIAHLDAKGLWELDPKRGRSQALDAAAARIAIQSVIDQAKVTHGRPIGEP